MSEQHYAHPMLEPVNYDLDPEQASQYFSGNELQIYNLLWNAAVATYVEGPVVRQHQLFSALSSNTSLCIKWNEMIETGWTNFIPYESVSISALNNPLLPSSVTPSFIPPYNEIRLQRCENLKNLALPLNSELETTVSVKKMPEAELRYSSLIEQMAKFKVARPSTYASRLESTIKNGLIGEDNKTLFLTATGKSYLDKITQLPPNEQLSKQTSFEIEKAIDAIEEDHKLSGTLLNDFCEKILQNTSKLSDWLDELNIEGETLQEIYNKSAQKTHGKGIFQKKEIEPPITTARNLEPSIIDILMNRNTSNAVNCIEHAWDDFSFQTQVLNINFTGRFHTRKANRLKTPKEKIFQEHLDDFQQILYLGFLKEIPVVDFANSIEFSILTDRTQGFWYLEKLQITYSYEPIINEVYGINITDIKNHVSQIFSDCEIGGHVRLCSTWDDGPEIVMNDEAPY